jgi:hypothetical protein
MDTNALILINRLCFIVLINVYFSGVYTISE